MRDWLASGCPLTFVIAAGLSLAGDDAKPVRSSGRRHALDVSRPKGLDTVGTGGACLVGVKSLTLTAVESYIIRGRKAGDGSFTREAEGRGGEDKLNGVGAHFENWLEVESSINECKAIIRVLSTKKLGSE